MAAFGELLKEFRKAKGFARQIDAAEACGYSTGYWSKLENASRPNFPPIENIDIIAEHLHLQESEKKQLVEAAHHYTSVTELRPMRLLMQALREGHVRNDIEDFVNQDLEAVIECWVQYATAKKLQYGRKWKQTVKVSEEAHNQIQLVACRLSSYLLDTKASAQLHLQELQDVEDTHSQMLPYIDCSNDDYIGALHTLHKGDLQRVSDHWDEAFAHYDDAYHQYSKIEGRQGEMARCDRKIAAVLLHQGDWRSANRYLANTLETFNNPKAEYELARTHYVFGWVYNLSGDWREAHNQHQIGFNIALEYKTRDDQTDRYLQMLGHSYLANDERQIKNWDKAQAHYEQAESIAIELGYKREDSWLCLGRARLAFQQALDFAENGEQESATDCFMKASGLFEKAEKESEKLKSNYHRAMNLVHYGRFLLASHQCTDEKLAHNKFTKALRLATDPGSHSRYYEASIYVALGEIHLRRREYDRLSTLADDVKALHDQYTFHNLMARMRAIEAKACLESQGCHTKKVAEYFGRAFCHALRFNEFSVDEILTEYRNSIEPLSIEQTTSLNSTLIGNLQNLCDIKPYVAIQQNARAKLLSALQGLQAP